MRAQAAPAPPTAGAWAREPAPRRPHSPAVAPHPHSAPARRGPLPRSAGRPVPVPDHGTTGPARPGSSRDFQHRGPPPTPASCSRGAHPPGAANSGRPGPGPRPAPPSPSGQWSASGSPSRGRPAAVPPRRGARPAPRLKRSQGPGSARAWPRTVSAAPGGREQCPRQGRGV